MEIAGPAARIAAVRPRLVRRGPGFTSGENLPQHAVRTMHQCRECGQQHSRWQGRCRSCNAWNSLDEVAARPASKRRTRGGLNDRGSATELSSLPPAPAARLKFGISELDRVFGGGIVPGSVVLLAGDPGVGKSTLLLHASAAVADHYGKVLYVSGEESAEQIRLRAGRLGIRGSGVFLLATNSVEAVLEQVDALEPALLVVDTIQTVASDACDSARGGVAQIQACAQILTEKAKSSGIPVVLTGHVTKDGSIAGPRLLEHAVDVVLHLSGDASGTLRLLHGLKNRYGATNEVGVFEMRGDGLAEVSDPSRTFLANRSAASPGSAVATVLEGTRPIAVEIQALTSPSALPAPRRVATGVDASRLHLVLAVLSRRLGIPVANQDVIVNVPGGLRIKEPAADLGMALAIVSSVRDEPVDPSLAAAAEVGLGGELRPVPQGDRRASDARRLGFAGCLLARPTGSEAALGEEAAGARHVSTLAEAIDVALISTRRGPQDGRFGERLPARAGTRAGQA